MSHDLAFPRRVFRWAAIYGVLALTPLFFTELLYSALGRPGVTHPEYLYGFIGTAWMMQPFYWVIGGDPVRYRPLMLVAVPAKLVFGVIAVLLFAFGRIGFGTLGFGLIDLVLTALFFAAWRRTPRTS